MASKEPADFTLQELIERDKTREAELRKLQQEVAELRDAISENHSQLGSLSKVLPTVELVNGRTVSRALYEDVRWKLSLLFKPHLQIVASKARNPSMLINDKYGEVDSDASRKYGIGLTYLTHREAFHRLGLIDAEGNMPEEIAAIVMAATELKGSHVELKDLATTEEVAAAEFRKAERVRFEALTARNRADEEARQRAEEQEKQRKQQQRLTEEERRQFQQAFESEKVQERLARRRRHQKSRRWIRLLRSVRVRFSELY